jgi:predicted RND superfamily exporter protein
MERLFKRPVLAAGIIAAITVFFLFQLPRAELDNNNFRFIQKGNPARVVSEYLDDTFGGSVIILVGLERPYGTVFDPEFLARIKDYAGAVELVEFVKDVNSIMSTQYISGDGDAIVVSDLVPEDFSGQPEEIAGLKRRISSWDLFSGSIVSDDLSATQIIVSLDVLTDDTGSPEVTASLIKIRDMAKEMFGGLAEVYVTGQPVISATINEAMKKDIIILIPLVVLVVLAVLFFSFRRFTFVILPLITVLVAVVWTVGAMPLFGIKLSIISTVLPIILVAVGSAYGIHVVTHYMEDVKDLNLNAEEHRALVFSLMRKLIKPVFLAALTTFAGFISFCFTPIVPMREFGLFAGFGVIVSFVVAVILIPALLLIRRGTSAFGLGGGSRGPRPPLRRRQEGGKVSSAGDKISGIIADGFLALTGKKYAVLAIAVLAVAVSLYGLSKLVVDNAVIEFFKNETDISRSDRFIRGHFGGSKEVSFVVEADTTEELLSPEVLSAVDDLSVYLTERVPAVGKVVGFTDIVKRINQVFNTDESPAGLGVKGGLSASAETNGSDFGFSTGFSIDDFGSGFGFDGEFDDAGEFDDPAGDVHSLEQYSAADIITLLDSAAGKSVNMSGNDVVRELKRLVNYDGMSYYEIPANPERYGKTKPEELQKLISNYLLLLAGGENGGYSNDPLEPTAIKTTIQLRTVGDKDTREVIDLITAYAAVNFPKTVRVITGGTAVMEGAITDLIVNSQIISIVISVLVVFIIIALSNRSFIAGIIAAVPLALTILCNFAVMGFLGIKLNIGTALIASLSVGIGIDYTIHFIEFFRHEFAAGHEDGNGFLRRTFVSCGKAILINALSVGAGFGVLAFSQFKILAELGSLIALNMAIAALVSLTIIPVLLTVIKPQFIYGRKT